jgi:hypothetical protein
VLQRWQQGEDLLSGKLGVGLKKGGVHFEPPEIASVWQGSPAAEAGWKPKDVIVAVDGQKVETQSQLRFLLVPRYAGDQVQVTVRREGNELQSQLTLTGKLDPFRHAFLGVLPERNAPAEDAPGVTLRSLWPKGPAARAALKPGDRITKIGEADIANFDAALAALDALSVDSSVTIVVQRDEKSLTLSAKLASLPEEILLREQLRSVDQGPNEDDDKPAELKPLKMLEYVQIAQYYAPLQQDDGPPLGLLLWLSSGKVADDLSLVDAWREECDRNGLMLVIAHPKDAVGWAADDSKFLVTLLRTVRRRFNLDMSRAVVCGRGKAGQLAFALAFRPSNGLSSAIGIDAPLPRTLRLPPSLPGRRLALLAVESKNSSFAPLIRKDIQLLREAGYPTSWLERPSAADQLEKKTRESISRWIDALDRF